MINEARKSGTQCSNLSRKNLLRKVFLPIRYLRAPAADRMIDDMREWSHGTKINEPGFASTTTKRGSQLPQPLPLHLRTSESIGGPGVTDTGDPGVSHESMTTWAPNRNKENARDEERASRGRSVCRLIRSSSARPFVWSRSSAHTGSLILVVRIVGCCLHSRFGSFFAFFCRTSILKVDETPKQITSDEPREVTDTGVYL